MTVTEIHLGVPCTYKAQQEMLDKGYTLQPHAHGVHRQRYVIASRPAVSNGMRPDFVGIAATVFGMRRDEIIFDWRDRPRVQARQAGMWAARQYGLSWPAIGAVFRRHHTSCLVGVRMARLRRWDNDEYKAMSDRVMSMVRSA